MYSSLLQTCVLVPDMSHRLGDGHDGDLRRDGHDVRPRRLPADTGPDERHAKPATAGRRWPGHPLTGMSMRDHGAAVRGREAHLVPEDQVGKDPEPIGRQPSAVVLESIWANWSPATMSSRDGWSSIKPARCCTTNSSQAFSSGPFGTDPRSAVVAAHHGQQGCRSRPGRLSSPASSAWIRGAP